MSLPLFATTSIASSPEPAETRQKQTALYGGQAIIEGVMMKGPERTVASCRAPNGTIVYKILREGPEENRKNIWYKTPILRGVFVLVDSLSIGYKALMYSGDVADPDAKPRTPWLEYTMLIVSLALALVVFKFVPVWIAKFIVGTPPMEANLTGSEMVKLSMQWSGVEGVTKVIVIVSYMLLIRLMKDIWRVFQYHGAEHKTINAYEAGSDLDVDDIARYPTFHPRCGTSFIFAVILFSLIFAMFFPLITLAIWGDPTIAMKAGYRFLMHIVFLPIIAAFGYEFIRFTAKMDSGSVFMKILTYPGRLFQKITVLEPDRDMLEVAVNSMRLAMGFEPLSIKSASTYPIAEAVRVSADSTSAA